MKNEFLNRSYLLPPGCKDLMDVLKLHEQSLPMTNLQDSTDGRYAWEWPAEMPPVKGEVIIPARTSAINLASLMRRNLTEILADLWHLEVFTFPSKKLITERLNETLDFETISRIARRYGFIAKKANE